MQASCSPSVHLHPGYLRNPHQRCLGVASTVPAVRHARLFLHGSSERAGLRPLGAATAGEGRARDDRDDMILPNVLSAVGDFSKALYQFSRPHTMIGTALSVTSISCLALGGAAAGAAAYQAWATALMSALLMNIAIVGINQLFDIEIDKVNKPYLPLASGALSPVQGAAIVAATAAASLAIGFVTGSPPLNATLVVSLVLGVVYSADIPFMRWKRSPVLAAGCILAVRAVVVQLGFYSHMRTALGLPQHLELTSPVTFTIGFMVFFSVVIALFKDIPDVAGDTRAGLRTLSVRLGEASVFWICVGLLTAAYGGAVAFCAVHAPPGAVRAAACAGHATLCALLWRGALRVDPARKKDLVDFYMFIWKLFYAEYLLIPFLGP